MPKAPPMQGPDDSDHAVATPAIPFSQNNDDAGAATVRPWLLQLGGGFRDALALIARAGQFLGMRLA